MRRPKTSLQRSGLGACHGNIMDDACGGESDYGGVFESWIHTFGEARNVRPCRATEN